MKSRILSLFMITVLIQCFSILTNAQVKPQTITKEEKAEFIEKVTKMLNDYYIYPEIAQQIDQHLKAKFAGGSFDSVTYRNKFTDLMTRELQSISHDKHMFVRLRPLQPKSPTEKPNPIASFYERNKSFEEGNFGFARVEKLEGNIGLLEITGFPPLQMAKDYADRAMKFLANSDALIIDCRRNGGGNPDLVQYVCSYLFEKPTLLNSLYYRKDNKTVDYVTFEKVDGKKLTDIAVYVLTSKRTFSGGEEFPYDLQSQKRAIVIGEITGGGAHPGELRPVLDDIDIFIPTGRAINPITKTDWEGVGVKPDIEVEASKALDTALSKARASAKAHRLSGDKSIYKLIDEIGLNMEKAEKLFNDKKKAEAESLIGSSIEKGVRKGLLREGMIDMLGYEYLRKDNFAMALSIFRLNAKLSPASANVYDSLGEVYFKRGENQSAIDNFKRSLELNPNNGNAKAMIKNLKTIKF